MLTIDKREKQDDLIAAVVAKCEDLHEPYEFKELTVGDFVFDGKICIEHKSTEDFKSSLHSGHLDSQMADIKQFPVHALVIEGRWKYVWDPKSHVYAHNFTPNHKNGKIAAYVFSETWKIPVVQVDNATEFANMLFMIRDQIEDLDTLPLPDLITRHTRTANHENHALNNLLSVKGLGFIRARELLKSYPIVSEFYRDYRETGCLDIPKTVLTKTARVTMDQLTGTDWANYKPPKKPRGKKTKPTP